MPCPCCWQWGPEVLSELSKAFGSLLRVSEGEQLAGHGSARWADGHRGQMQEATRLVKGWPGRSQSICVGPQGSPREHAVLPGGRAAAEVVSPCRCHRRLCGQVCCSPLYLPERFCFKKEEIVAG